MNRKINAVVAGLTAAAALSLVGCSDGGSTSGKASGLRDDVKYTKAVKAVAAISHKVTTKEPKTKRVCVSRKNGSCKTYQDRPDGFKTVTKTVVDKPGRAGKSASYCVELDNVNGNQDSDDQWFTVSAGTYWKQAASNEGAKVENMKYLHKGLSC